MKKDMNFNKLVKFTIFSSVMSLLPLLSACSEVDLQSDELVTGLEDAWNETEDPVRNFATAYLKSAAQNPKVFGEKNYQAEWNEYLDEFTLTWPVDWAQNAELSFFFGDFGKDLNDIYNYCRENMDKDAAIRIINRKFNDTWATMMISLILVDGRFEYVVETDGWDDNDFEFDADEMADILTQQGYFTSKSN